jgi:hypothetical protein
MGEVEVGGTRSEQRKQKGTGGMAQVVKGLPSEHEALSTAKNK